MYQLLCYQPTSQFSDDIACPNTEEILDPTAVSTRIILPEGGYGEYGRGLSKYIALMSPRVDIGHDVSISDSAIKGNNTSYIRS